jgi:HEAT repeat protein
VLAYLDHVAAEAARMPRYFPSYMNSLEPGSTALDDIRQSVQIATDRKEFERGKAEENDRLRAASVPVRQDPDRWNEKDDKKEDRRQTTVRTIVWDEHAAREFSRAILLGDPGFGKGWLLRYEARRLARRNGAAEALGQLGDARAIKPLLALLGDGDTWGRRDAIQALEQLGVAGADGPPLGLLRDEDNNAPLSAATPFRQLDASAVEPLPHLLRDRDIDVRCRAAVALARFGDARALEPLLGLLRVERRDIPWQAADALGQLGDAPAIEPLLEFFRNPTSDIVKRSEAVRDEVDVAPLLSC